MNARLALLILAILLPASTAHGADSMRSKTPIFIELFTSEGCSSCPPADAWLQQMDATQPIPDAQVIVLSEHVNYWDHEGWKDPFSLTVVTERQIGYVRALGLSTAYTPQAIVNGIDELQLDQSNQVRRVLVKAASGRQAPVSISALKVEDRPQPVLQAHIDVDGEHVNRNADIFAVVALDHAKTQVARGENGGRILTHVAVAQELLKVGRLEKGAAFSGDIRVNLHPNAELQNLRLIVFVQEPGPGRVLGAALQKMGLDVK